MIEGVSRYVTVQDGLRLHVRDFEAASDARLPAVCLPGLSRPADDFTVLATALSDGRAYPARRVAAIDYRGRGLSAWDPDPRNYDYPVESADIAAVLTALDIPRAVFIGTSRGGLHTMLMAALRPSFLAGAVLNDIGPVIAAEGLARIKGYIGKVAPPADWPAAVAALKGIAGGQFSGLDDDEWLAYARLTFAEADGGGLKGRYDPGLMENLKTLDLAKIPELWPQFEGLRHVPLLVIRGAESDLLTVETATAMVTRHPDAALVTVPGQGHAPLLMDQPTIGRIAAFLAHCDAASGVGQSPPETQGQA